MWGFRDLGLKAKQPTLTQLTFESGAGSDIEHDTPGDSEELSMSI